MSRFAWTAALTLALAGCDNQPECARDEDCHGVERCLEGACIDDSCQPPCPAGQYCQSYVCYTCYYDSRCGASCIDCVAMGNDMACVYWHPLELYQCGCWGDWDCALGLCCEANHCGPCR